MSTSSDILKKYWGFDQFRPLQEEIVESAIYGHDTFAILPTGGGKSICFQVPGIAREGLTLVISPLIALMQDQVNNLNVRDLKSIMIASSMSYREIDVALDNARFGETKFLYTSPERLKTKLFIERFKQMDIGLIVVDEAHCISEWGHDFRPSYREIAVLREYHPETPIIALTASATREVQDDIISQLKLKNPKIFKGDVNRSNIAYRVASTQNKLDAILDHCDRNRNSCGIVYCQTRKSVKDVVRQLRAKNVAAGMYHGGMSNEDRKFMLDLWMNDQIKVMVATNAFGMGIDKPDVRYVLHYEIPANLESYYQEAGRAGRDGKEALAIAFWETADIDKLREQLAVKYPETERIKQIYNAICNFLQVAVGSGESEVYPFDILGFSKVFKFPVSEIYHSIKILELNGNFSLTENNFFPTRLKIAVENSTLYKFQVTHETVANLITLITRSYPGVFDKYISINEDEFCKRLNITKGELKKQFELLEQFGVIEIRYQTHLPQLTLTTERIADQNLTIKADVYHRRKATETNKLEALIEFITSEYCRAELIAAYFGSTPTKCGKCDVCMDEFSNNYSHNELIEMIPTMLPIDINGIVNKTRNPKSSIEKAIGELVLEEKLVFIDGKYFLANS